MRLRFAHQPLGFSLIELVLVIGILGILLTITLIAINPARQFQQANNTKRSSDVTAILNAIHQYAVDHRGALPSNITTSTQAVADPGANICSDLVPTYIAALPSDPTTSTSGNVTNCGAAYNTRYTVIQSATNNRVTVSAPNAELGASISVER